MAIFDVKEKQESSQIVGLNIMPKANVKHNAKSASL